MTTALRPEWFEGISRAGYSKYKLLRTLEALAVPKLRFVGMVERHIDVRLPALHVPFSRCTTDARPAYATMSVGLVFTDLAFLLGSFVVIDRLNGQRRRWHCEQKKPRESFHRILLWQSGCHRPVPLTPSDFDSGTERNRTLRKGPIRCSEPRQLITLFVATGSTLSPSKNRECNAAAVATTTQTEKSWVMAIRTTHGAKIAYLRAGAAYRTRTCDPRITKARLAFGISYMLQLLRLARFG